MFLQNHAALPAFEDKKASSHVPIKYFHKRCLHLASFESRIDLSSLVEIFHNLLCPQMKQATMERNQKYRDFL